MYYRPVPALIFLGLAVASGAALAQPSAPQVVTVVAPHVVVHKEMARSYNTGAPIEQISYIQYVGYGDLNLNKPSDVDELKKRVADTAKAGCAELDRLYPPTIYLPNPANQRCVDNAIDTSAPQIDAAVAAAMGK